MIGRLILVFTTIGGVPLCARPGELGLSAPFHHAVWNRGPRSVVIVVSHDVNTTKIFTVPPSWTCEAICSQQLHGQRPAGQPKYVPLHAESLWEGADVTVNHAASLVLLIALIIFQFELSNVLGLVGINQRSQRSLSLSVHGIVASSLFMLARPSAFISHSMPAFGLRTVALEYAQYKQVEEGRYT